MLSWGRRAVYPCLVPVPGSGLPGRMVHEVEAFQGMLYDPILKKLTQEVCSYFTKVAGVERRETFEMLNIYPCLKLNTYY